MGHKEFKPRDIQPDNIAREAFGLAESEREIRSDRASTFGEAAMHLRHMFYRKPEMRTQTAEIEGEEQNIWDYVIDMLTEAGEMAYRDMVETGDVRQANLIRLKLAKKNNEMNKIFSSVDSSADKKDTE